MISHKRWLIATFGLVTMISLNSPARATTGPVPLYYLIVNNSDATAQMWYGVTDGTINNQNANATLSAGLSTSGQLTLPRATVYEGFSQSTIISPTLVTPAQCWMDFYPSNVHSLKSMTSKVTLSGNATTGYSCTVSITGSY